MNYADILKLESPDIDSTTKSAIVKFVINTFREKIKPLLNILSDNDVPLNTTWANEINQLGLKSFLLLENPDKLNIKQIQYIVHVVNKHITKILLLSEFNAEEDSNENSNEYSDPESLAFTSPFTSHKDCPNPSPITLMEYDASDDIDLFTISILDTKKQFRFQSCLTKSELTNYIQSDQNQVPFNIMAIYTKPLNPQSINDMKTGFTAVPTGKFVIRLPQNQIYVTPLSVYKILHLKNKEWFAIPLFNGKKKRIGNLAGVYGQNLNHGQIPGFKIYKLFSKEEILSKISVKENTHEYLHPYPHSHLSQILGSLKNNKIISLSNMIINSLVQRLESPIE